MFDRFYAGEHNYFVAFIVALLCGFLCAITLVLVLSSPITAENADAPHRWFAWHPVRLQGGRPIPTVQEGGRIVWLKTIERFRFFDHWVYREIGDTRQLTQ